MKNDNDGFQPHELIITTGGGKVQSAGFTIFNHFLNNKIQPMYTINKTELTTKPLDKVSSLFDGFVVPIGLHLSHHDEKDEENVCDRSYENVDVIDEDIYDALLKLSGQDELVSTYKKPTKNKSKNVKKKDTVQKKNKTKKNKEEQK